MTDKQYHWVSTMPRKAKRGYWRKHFNYLSYTEFNELLAAKEVEIRNREPKL